MMLESLAKAILLDLFEYFDSTDLIYTFCGLNSHFNNLLFIHFQTHSLQFRFVSKHIFDNIYHQHLRCLTDKILSLHLFNNNEIPNLAEYFLSRSFHFKQFNHLQSLSLYEINSSRTLNQIIHQCYDFLYFTHLYITKCNFSWEDNRAARLINTIWSLSKLSHLTLDIHLFEQFQFNDIKKISLSIESLSIYNYAWNFSGLSYLFEYTPYLRSLSTISINNSSDLDSPCVVPLISKLKLSLIGFINTTWMSFDSMNNFFSKMPNLSYLTIETIDINLNGNEWKNILIEYLPNIKVFQLNMNFNFDLNINKEEQVDKLLDSFRTSFWIEEHLWFVCCDWHPSPTNTYGFLYTLPYALDKYVYEDQICSKTTYPSHLDYSVYNRINTLKIMVLEKDSVLDLNIPSKFPNIRHLDLCLSFNNNISSIILSFNHLTSLKISDMPYSSYYNYVLLQMLFDRSPHLNLLSLYQVLFHKSMVYKLTSTTIRRLELIPTAKTDCGFLNREECSNLIKSPLGQQCEVLKVGVKNRLDIIQILKTMCHLRLLIVQCDDDDDTQVFCRSFFSTHDRILKWLQQRLLFKYSIARDINNRDSIRIWIR